MTGLGQQTRDGAIRIVEMVTYFLARYQAWSSATPAFDEVVGHAPTGLWPNPFVGEAAIALPKGSMDTPASSQSLLASVSELG